MNSDEPQPEYCDCDGFHTGACEAKERVVAHTDPFNGLHEWVRRECERLRRRIGQLTRQKREPRKSTRGPADKSLG